MHGEPPRVHAQFGLDLHGVHETGSGNKKGLCDIGKNRHDGGERNGDRGIQHVAEGSLELGISSKVICMQTTSIFIRNDQVIGFVRLGGITERSAGKTEILITERSIIQEFRVEVESEIVI